MMTFLALKNTFLSMILVTWKNFYAKSLGKKTQTKIFKIYYSYCVLSQVFNFQSRVCMAKLSAIQWTHYDDSNLH